MIGGSAPATLGGYILSIVEEAEEEKACPVSRWDEGWEPRSQRFEVDDGEGAPGRSGPGRKVSWSAWRS